MHHTVHDVVFHETAQISITLTQSSQINQYHQINDSTSPPHLPKYFHRDYVGYKSPIYASFGPVMTVKILIDLEVFFWSNMLFS